MNLDKRLAAVGSFVPQGAVLADIGTDHAYLPVVLLQQGKIARAIAGDIAAGPCQAARNTVAMAGLKQLVEVRQGSGLQVLQPGEVDCIAIAGMGASTIIMILEDSPEVTASAKQLVLQPMAGAASLRRWLCQHGWQLQAETLVEDGRHFYEIISAVPAGEQAAPSYSEAQYTVGPWLLENGHELLPKQIQRQADSCRKLLEQMGLSLQARQSAKYKATEELLQELEAMSNAGKC